MLVDSHAHFDHLPDEQAVGEVLQRARAAGVGRIIAIGGHAAANAQAIAITRCAPDLVRATVGFDRDQAAREVDHAALIPLLSEPEVVAIGEIGLDYYYSRDTRAMQLTLFERMLEHARSVRKPIVVHSRDADEDTLQLLKAHCEALRDTLPYPGVLHCFTGSLPFAERLLEMGLLIGFSGIITFKNAAALREIAKVLPEDRILVETDSPYLAPEPVRGKRNEPAHVAHVAAALAKIRGDSAERIAHITAQNAVRLFEPSRKSHE